MEALQKTCMIDPDGPMFKCKFTRCGRTDKGVSALLNVCSLFVRKLKNPEEYTMRLNRCLPDDIRILGHCVVPPHFDARFSCVYREYNYFFFKQNMNIPVLAKAALKFLGMHDFRNFCKKDESFGKFEDQ